VELKEPEVEVVIEEFETKEGISADKL